MSKIREMQPREYRLLEEFLYQAIYTAPDETRPPRSVTADAALRAYTEGFGRTGDVAVCVEEDGEIVGAAWARLMRGYGFVDEGVPEIAMSVLPGYRGRGIGTALLTALVKRCAELGALAVSLSVQRANPALSLYRRLGFTEVAGDGTEAVMVLPLAPSRLSREERVGVPFLRARVVALRVLIAPTLKGRVFLTGGLVPWLASGCDSGRLHGDVDVAVRMDDMAHVRAWLAVEGLYDPALDSLCLECNEGHGDYGVHAAVDSVLVSFCPFYSEGGIEGGLHQRNAALVEIDGFEGLLEAVLPGLVESDYVEVRTLPSGEDVGCATLESVRAAKTASGCEKDARDIAEIDRIGYDSGRYARISPAYAAMRIDCIAHGE